MLKVGTQAVVGEHLDSALEELGEILFEADEVEKRSSRLDVDEKINVAVGSIVTARDGAEHTDISDPVTGRELKNLAAMRPQTIDRHETIIPARGRLVSASARSARGSEVEAAGRRPTSGTHIAVLYLICPQCDHDQNAATGAVAAT